MHSASRSGTKPRDVALMAVIAAVAVLLCLPLLGYGFSFDQGVFSTIAETMLRGGVAYRDAWEHKPPGIFYVYYFSFLVIQREIWAVRLVEIAALAVSAVLIFILVRRRCGSTLSGMIAGLMLPLYYLAFGDNTAQPESFQIPLLLGAFALLPDVGETVNLRRRCFAAGMLLASAVLFKTPVILFTGILIGERLLLDRHERSLRGRLEPSALTIAGMLLPPVVLLAYYACRGAGPAILDALFVYPRQYVAVGLQRTLPSHVEECFRWTEWMLPLSSLILLTLGIVRGALVRGTETFRWAGFFLTSLATVVLQGRYFEYHFLPVVPAVAWGAGLLFSRPRAGLTAPAPKALVWTLTGLLIAVTMSQSLWYARSRWASLGSLAHFDSANHQADPDGTWALQRDIARQIRTLTRDDGRIFVWGDEPLLYVQADRRMAGPNCHLMQIAPPWGGTDRMTAFLSRLANDAPQLILVTSHRLWWRNGQSPIELLQYYPEMQQFLDESYTFMPGPNGYQFWLRRPRFDGSGSK